VIAVAVPLPVAAISSVRPVRCVVPAVRPSFASADPLTVRSLDVPVLSVISPPLTDEAVPVPVMVSIAVRMLLTVAEARSIVAPLAEMVLPAPVLTKLMLLPSTVSVSPVVMAEESAVKCGGSGSCAGAAGGQCPEDRIRGPA